MSENPNREIFEEFLIESFENLSNINDELTQFEKEPNQMEILNSIYRKVHTVKGSSSFLGLKKLQEVTHASENLLDLIREKKFQINSEIVDLLLKNFDTCNEILTSIEETGNEGTDDYSTIVSKTVGIIEKNLITTEKICIDDKSILDEKLKVEKSKIMTENKINTVVEPKKVEEKVMKDKLVAKKTEEKKSPDHSKAKLKALTDSVVKVNVQLLDKIMNVVGELVLNRNQIIQYSQSEKSPELNRLAQQLNGITTELQQDIMTTRMQPVGTVLNKFERIVRDLARSQGKKIRLNLTGQDTELDKSLIESIKDPLTHLIRNSVDHGIERPLDRVDSGKDEEGVINIKAYHEGGQVTIEIQDDGKGINPEIILNKAIEKGVVTKEIGEKMPNKDILHLVFAPGFSTAEEVTSISGRGVGMDVVKSNIEKIRGTVDVSSVVGEGSSFKLKIPLTLAIVPSLIVKDNGATFVISQANLVELVRIEDTEEGQNQIERIHDSEFFRLRDNLIPIFRLSKVLGTEQKMDDKDTDLNIAVLNADGAIYGLVIDSILDTEEIVVKPLSNELKSLNIYAGATIMGDGRVALILDAMGFYSFVSSTKTDTKGLVDTHDEKVSENQLESHEFVLCKLFNDQIYAFPLCYVNRLEEFHGKNVERSGSNYLIRYRETATPLVNISELSQQEIELQDLCEIENISTIIVENNDKLVGLVVKEIMDIALSFEDINNDISSGTGILGTTFINDLTINVFDVHGILSHYGLRASKAIPGDSRKGARILLLEDSPLYQKMLCESFREYEHEFVVVSHGVLGLDKLNNDGEFDLIVSDINMPEMDGTTFVKTVRSKKNKSFSDIPIIAISTDMKEVDVKKNLEIGFTSYVEKVNQDEIIEVVQKLLAA